MSAGGLGYTYEELKEALRKLMPKNVANGKCFADCRELKGVNLPVVSRREVFYRVDLETGEVMLLRPGERKTMQEASNYAFRQKGLLPDLFMASVLYDLSERFEQNDKVLAALFASVREQAERNLLENGVKWNKQSPYRLPLTNREMLDEGDLLKDMVYAENIRKDPLAAAGFICFVIERLFNGNSRIVRIGTQ